MELLLNLLSGAKVLKGKLQESVNVMMGIIGQMSAGSL